MLVLFMPHIQLLIEMFLRKLSQGLAEGPDPEQSFPMLSAPVMYCRRHLLRLRVAMCGLPQLHMHPFMP